MRHVLLLSKPFKIGFHSTELARVTTDSVHTERETDARAK